ncbi:MAG: outer membrane receptor for ferrienterochelin and colicin [Candidatus Azotimanducaceae bacterium]|jgi:outer membrane receptor for ferrienterochelin and colicin
MNKLLCLLGLIFFSLQGISQNITISGYVKDAANGETMLGVNVVEPIRLLGATTNTYGFYTISVPKGDIQLSYSFIGYKTERLQFTANSDTSINVEISVASEVLGEVVLTAEETIEKKVEMSVIDVPIAQIQKLPALMGEVDVMKTLQLLPGVQSGGEGTSGLYVRGGSPDQNLILLDGVPVYNASHLFGFFSVFNADAIKNVKLTKGGFPAQYGGRLSSVLEIDMKEGNSKEFKGSASIGLVASKLTLEGPIGKNEKTSYIISGRRTYIDALAQPFIALAEPGSRFGYYFGDLNAKINHTFSDKDRLFLSVYTGIDRFYGKFKYKDSYEETKEEFGLDWGNLTSAFRWNHIINNRLFSNLTATFTRYQFSVDGLDSYKDLSTNDVEEFSFKFLSDIIDYGMKYDLEYHPDNDHTIRFGANVVNHSFRPGAIQINQSGGGEELDSLLELSENRKALESYIYAGDEWDVNPRLRLSGGLHFSLYNLKSTTYTSLQPRFSGRFLLTDEWAFKASYAEMQQYLHLLSSSGAGLPTDLWVGSTEDTPPQTSRQVAIGVSRMLFNNGFEFSVESYYKEMEGLITYKDGTSFVGNADWEDKIETGGIGTSYGIEMFLQKKKGKTTGWVGYTWSHSTRQFEQGQINGGLEYPYRYDRRHDISLVVSHSLSDNVEISGTWVYGTGNATTIGQGEHFLADNGGWFGTSIYTDYGEKNSFRMAPYHRLDLGIQFHKDKKKGRRTWAFSVYNAYNRKNPFFLDYRTTYTSSSTSKRELVQYSLFPIIPSFSYSFKF